MGSETITVSDDGLGIDPLNYESIALKHCTSKITEFNDLSMLNGFGFRGEAINAICEISQNVNITTKQSLQSVGNELKFARDGK